MLLSDKQIRIFQIIHFVNLVIWVVFNFIYDKKVEEVYNKLFQAYIPFKVFDRFVLFYMIFGTLLLWVLFKLFKKGALIIFELVIIAINCFYLYLVLH